MQDKFRTHIPGMLMAEMSRQDCQTPLRARLEASIVHTTILIEDLLQKPVSINVHE